MANMLGRPGNAYMQPLHALRAYLKANQYDPSKRNWLARTVKDDGTVTIAPNSYSPDYSEELLRIVLSIQMRENDDARREGVSPRFQLLTSEDVIAIEFMWSRYGYHRTTAAMKIYKEVVLDRQFVDVPVVAANFPHKAFPRFSQSVPFADEEYCHFLNGLRDVYAMTADCESTVTNSRGDVFTAVNTDVEFTVDQEGAAMFFDYELDFFLDNYGQRGYTSTQVAFYFLRLGVISLNKGGHAENARMLRMANQIQRLGIAPLLNDPERLIERLSGLQAPLRNSSQQLSLLEG